MSVRHLLPLLIAAAAPALRAQATTSLQIDATVLPRHQLGLRVLTGFARFDELLGTGGARNLGQSLVADSIGALQIAQLGSTEAALRTLTGNSGFSINAGSLVAKANSRVLTAPLMLEYGLTRRLTLGLVVPLVETRSTVFAQLNPRVGTANVGANPGSAAAWANNAQLTTSLRAAATALNNRLAQCRATPSGAGCDALLAQQAAATALIGSTDAFVTAFTTVYGVGANQPGTFFIPVANSPAQTAVANRLAALRSSYQSFGGTVANLTPAGAPGPAAQADLQRLLESAGYDSLTSRDRSSIGDITLGATYQLANTFADTARLASNALLYRVAVHAAGRLGTGQPANRNRLFDNSTGYGQPGAIVGAAADLRVRPRVFFTGLASYTKQLGSVNVSRPANADGALLPLTYQTIASYSAGDVLSVTAIPRYRIAGLFSIDGIYALTRIGADDYTVPAIARAPEDPTNPSLVRYAADPPFGVSAATTHQVGIGFTYSSSLTDRGPGRLPYEASFRHTETISASGGPVAKTFVDQLQLRVFFR